MATKATFSTNWKSKKATDKAIADFESAFGKSMGVEVSRSDDVPPLKVIPTGILAIDYALGIGGLPCGSINEIWGPEHAGKTTISMLMVASAQRLFPDKMCAWVDMEQTFDKAWAKKLGVDLKRLWLIENPQSAEDVADSVKRFTHSGLCSLVVLDSVGGMIGRKEFEKESDEATVAIVAGIVTRMVKQCAPMAKANDTTVLVVNQVRANIGGYGATEQSSGGWALRHITTIKLQVKRGYSDPKTITVDGKPLPVSFEVTVKVQKNKRYPYGKVATFWLVNQATDKYGPVGVDPVTEAVDFGKRMNVIEGSSWLTLPSGKRFQGAPKAIDYLREHLDEVAEIREKVLATLSGMILDEGEDDPTGMSEFLAAGGEAE